MIKYADLEGYQNSGEFGMFSHLYRFFEEGAEKPIMIFLHAYEIIPAKVFKGIVNSDAKSYSNVDLTKEEKETLQGYVGEIQQVDFIEFANSHQALAFVRDFTKEG